MPLLIAQLEDSDSDVRTRAIGSLVGEDGSKNPEVAKALVAMLHDPAAEVRMYMISSFGAGALGAKEAVVEMRHIAAFDQSDEVRIAAVKALEHIAARDQ
jgi:HEAT repeat protein